MDTSNDLTRQGIAALKAGDRVTAAKVLRQATKLDPRNQVAWLWLAGSVEDDAYKRVCLEKVVAIDGTTETAQRARAGLEKMGYASSYVPWDEQETDIVVSPHAGARASRAKLARKSKRWMGIGVGVAVVLVVCLLAGISVGAWLAMRPSRVASSDSSQGPTPMPALSLATDAPLVPTATPTPAPPTATPTPAPPTATPRPPTPTTSPRLEKASWGTVDIRALVKNPDRYVDAELHYEGEVLSIEEGDFGAAMQVWVDIPGGGSFDREVVMVIFGGDTTPIYEGTNVEFWGYGDGSFEGTNAFGATIVNPIIIAKYLSYSAY